MEHSTVEIYPVKEDQEIKAVKAEEKKAMRKKMADLVGEEFMTQAIDDHLANVSAMKENDRVRFNRMVNGELKAGSEEFKKYAEEINDYLNKKDQDSGAHSDPRQNLIALMRCLESAQRESVVKHDKELLIKEVKNELAVIKKNNPAVEDYLREINFDLLRNADYKAIINIDTLDIKDYERRLMEYFKNKRPKDDKKEKILKLDPAVVNNSDVYKCYSMLCHIKKQEPFNPETFVNIL